MASRSTPLCPANVPLATASSCAELQNFCCFRLIFVTLESYAN